MLSQEEHIFRTESALVQDLRILLRTYAQRYPLVKGTDPTPVFDALRHLVTSAESGLGTMSIHAESVKKFTTSGLPSPSPIPKDIAGNVWNRGTTKPTRRHWL